MRSSPARGWRAWWRGSRRRASATRCSTKTTRSNPIRSATSCSSGRGSGLVDADLRPDAEARYAYTGIRERYGMVRSRDMLPVSSCCRDRSTDLTLGAFPRLRAPATTSDAVLYR